MNRPRNRQSRPPRDSPRNTPARSSQARDSNVPTIQQVVPGASVSIVLKADQRTGREVQGVVKDLLTRGDHPRGIKVRLQDGRVGRVQRMSIGDTSTVSNSVFMRGSLRAAKPGEARRSNESSDDYSQGPPPRSLADFMPGSNSDDAPAPPPEDTVTFSSAAAKCPICGLFEGDEAAVSHHVEEHLT